MTYPWCWKSHHSENCLSVALGNLNNFRLLLGQLEIASTPGPIVPGHAILPSWLLASFEPFVRISCCLCLQAKFICRPSSAMWWYPCPISHPIVSLSAAHLRVSLHFQNRYCSFFLCSPSVWTTQPLLLLLAWPLLLASWQCSRWWENGNSYNNNVGNRSLINIIRIHCLALTWQRRGHLKKYLYLCIQYLHLYL